MVLAIHASHIECGRIFSLAGMVTRSLRNIMSVENVSAHVFIHKNLDLATEVADNMKSAYGRETYSGNFAAYTKIKTEAQFAASIIDRVKCADPNSDDFDFHNLQ